MCCLLASQPLGAWCWHMSSLCGKKDRVRNLTFQSLGFKFSLCYFTSSIGHLLISFFSLKSGNNHIMHIIGFLWRIKKCVACMAPHSSTLAWKIPWTEEPWYAAAHGVAGSQTWLSDFILTFHFHALEKEMATHFSILSWRIPGTGKPGGLPSMGSHRVRHDWSDLAAAAAAAVHGNISSGINCCWYFCSGTYTKSLTGWLNSDS